MKKGIILLLIFTLIAMDNADADSQDDSIAYENPTTLDEAKLVFNMEQSVSGTGFFSMYKYSLMPDALGTEGRLFNGVEAKHSAHGSGSIDKDSKMYAESSYTNKSWIGGALDEDGEVILDEEETTSIVQIKEDGRETYSPTAMGIGTGYYNFHSVSFDSLLKEDDWIKNRNGLNSLHHSIDNAHGLDIALDAQSDNTYNIMSVDEDLINGRAHFGALQLAAIPVDEVSEESDSEEPPALGAAMKAWMKPSMELDEDYVGTFHIMKNMTLYTYSEEKEKEEDWLPCCSGGWDDMPYYDRISYGKSARGVFDCQCFKLLKA
ncbi:MAG: hypothetical protein ACE14P_01825 [Methanotrichaceae archaeon]